MKNIKKFTFIVAVITLTFSASSCSKDSGSNDCCSVSLGGITTEFCEDDAANAGYDSWAEYKDKLESGGYTCD